MLTNQQPGMAPAVAPAVAPMVGPVVGPVAGPVVAPLVAPVVVPDIAIPNTPTSLQAAELLDNIDNWNLDWLIGLQ